MHLVIDGTYYPERFSQTFLHFYSFVPSVLGRMSGPTESISSVQRWPSFLLTFDRAGRLFGEFNLTILPLKCQGLERLKAAAQRFGAESKKVQAGWMLVGWSRYGYQKDIEGRWDRTTAYETRAGFGGIS